MVHNLVHNLCESLVTNIGGIADTGKRTPPVPIIYLTQWKMMGNSIVHTDEYLTQWKVEGNSQIQQYLTQWKVEGNSVVDNNAILSCGDLGQDGKYHIKISNGVDVFDIALTEPLRKVNDVADSIEFINGVTTLTRKCAYIDLGTLNWAYNNNHRVHTRFGLPIRPDANNVCQILNNGGYTSVSGTSISSSATQDKMIAYFTLFVSEIGNGFVIRDERISSSEDARQVLSGVYAVYELATPTTEIIQAPQISVSSTYTSANDTPYSAFTYANPLIYSCGDYSDVDGKYHVKISNGVSIYDIPLTEPLRKVNNVTDNIEFVNGSAVLTRNLASALLSDVFWYKQRASNGKYIYSTHGFESLDKPIKPAADNAKVANVLCSIYDTIPANEAYICSQIGISVETTMGQIYLYDENYDQEGDIDDFRTHIQGAELIYEVATPTTETIQVSPFPVSPTDTYTSANDTPYSAFEYKKNVEIWSCGEYNAIDGKYHILVQPLGGSIADIALDEPLRKVNDVADTIEFADGVATVTRNFGNADLGNCLWNAAKISGSSDIYRMTTYSVHDTLKTVPSEDTVANILTSIYNSIPVRQVNAQNTGIGANTAGYIIVYDENYNQSDSAAAFKTAMAGVELIYELKTPTTETIQVLQIQKADSYSCVISQGGKAVSWSSFETT